MTIAKALVGSALAGLGALATALEDGAITGQEWVTIAVATVAALGLVWAVPNAARRDPVTGTRSGSYR